MAAKHSRHVAFNADLLRRVEAHVADGKYTSVSEMVRVGLRLLLDQEDAKAVNAAAKPRVQKAAS